MKENPTTKTNKNDAKRWLIIGAHQAGATDKQIAKMCGISQPSVRRIILNFQTTGSPCISKALTRKGMLTHIILFFFFALTNTSLFREIKTYC